MHSFFPTIYSIYLPQSIECYINVQRIITESFFACKLKAAVCTRMFASACAIFPLNKLHLTSNIHLLIRQELYLQWQLFSTVRTYVRMYVRAWTDYNEYS